MAAIANLSLRTDVVYAAARRACPGWMQTEPVFLVSGPAAVGTRTERRPTTATKFAVAPVRRRNPLAGRNRATLRGLNRWCDFGPLHVNRRVQGEQGVREREVRRGGKRLVDCRTDDGPGVKVGVDSA